MIGIHRCGPILPETSGTKLPFSLQQPQALLDALQMTGYRSPITAFLRAHTSRAA